MGDELYKENERLRSENEQLRAALAPLRGIGAQCFIDERNCLLIAQNELQREIERLRALLSNK
tara:strand:+ start:13415 stop:13603 length:189 start_codon:yes stop_codon:yes gene_type:complete